MELSELRPLTRWKHIEVLYERLSSGGMSVRQRDRLRAELEHMLQTSQSENVRRGGHTLTSDQTGHSALSPTP